MALLEAEEIFFFEEREDVDVLGDGVIDFDIISFKIKKIKYKV